jgi:antitoxin VapB
MAFSIKNDEADGLLRELVALTGESLTTAVVSALRERLERERRAASLRGSDRLSEAIAALRALAERGLQRAGESDDELLGFDAEGLPA